MSAQSLLDRGTDLALARLAAAGGDPRRLEDPLRTVAVVRSAQGVALLPASGGE